MLCLLLLSYSITSIIIIIYVSSFAIVIIIYRAMLDPPPRGPPCAVQYAKLGYFIGQM